MITETGLAVNVNVCSLTDVLHIYREKDLLGLAN